MPDILNMPSLSPDMQAYARSFVCGTREHDVTVPYTFHAEFIQWTDTPEAWAGAWAKDFVLCVVRDYSATQVRSQEELEASFRSYATYCIHNVPYGLRQHLPQTCFAGDLPCSRSTITRAEYDELWRNMCNMDREAWQSQQQATLTGLLNDINATPTIEQPISIHLAGTDDSSWSLCVGTRKEALEIVAGLRNAPSWALLNDYGFLFTN